MDSFERSALTPKDISGRILEEAEMHRAKILGVREHIAYGESRIGEIAAGCAQWLAVAFTLPENTSLLMFRGQMEQFLRLIILDTLFYETICREYSGGPVRYHPLLETDAGPSYATPEQTIGLLRAAFGDMLHPELAKWEDAERKGLLIPSGFTRR